MSQSTGICVSEEVQYSLEYHSYTRFEQRYSYMIPAGVSVLFYVACALSVVLGARELSGARLIFFFALPFATLLLLSPIDCLRFMLQFLEE